MHQPSEEELERLHEAADRVDASSHAWGVRLPAERGGLEVVLTCTGAVLRSLPVQVKTRRLPASGARCAPVGGAWSWSVRTTVR